jgi:hypothetical protein
VHETVGAASSSKHQRNVCKRVLAVRLAAASSKDMHARNCVQVSAALIVFFLPAYAQVCFVASILPCQAVETLAPEHAAIAFKYAAA